MGAETPTVVKTSIIEDVRLGRSFNEAKTLLVTVAATADNGDDFSVDLANYGGATLLAAEGVIHTTANSVIVAETITTAVSDTTVTVTIGGTTANKVRAVKLLFS